MFRCYFSIGCRILFQKCKKLDGLELFLWDLRTMNGWDEESVVVDDDVVIIFVCLRKNMWIQLPKKKRAQVSSREMLKFLFYVFETR